MLNLRFLLVFALGSATMLAADLAGSWNIKAETEDGPRQVPATFAVDGEKVSGKLAGVDVTGTFKDNKLNLAFPFRAGEDGSSGTLRIAGTLDGDTLKGTWDFRDQTGSFVATRVKAAIAFPGTWTFKMETEGGPRESTVTFGLNGDQVTGKWTSADVKGTFKDGKLNLAFPFHSDEGGMDGTLRFVGELSGDAIKGKWDYEGHDGTFVATKAK